MISRADGRRYAKVEDFHGAVACELDIRRLQIAMDNAPLMGRIERISDLLCIAESGSQRHWAGNLGEIVFLNVSDHLR